MLDHLLRAAAVVLLVVLHFDFVCGLSPMRLIFALDIPTTSFLMFLRRVLMLLETLPSLFLGYSRYYFLCQLRFNGLFYDLTNDHGAFTTSIVSFCRMGYCEHGIGQEGRRG